MDTMILLLYLQSGLDLTLDQAKLRGPIPIPHDVQAAWQDVVCIKLANNVRLSPSSTLRRSGM
jgi:hypothetical protein